MSADVAAVRGRAPLSRVRSLAARDWLALGLGAGGIGLVLLIGALLFRTYGGDASIYLPYARNIAHGDFFSYNPHEFSSGSTSPLWAVVLSVPFALGGSVAAAKLYAVLWVAAAFAVSLLAARRISGSGLAAAFAAFFIASTVSVVGAQMYESALVVVVVAATLWAGQRVAERLEHGSLDARTLAPLAAAWAALPLSRPESALLVPVQIAALWATAPARRRRDLVALLAAAAVAALPALAYFGYSQITLGVPSTSTLGRSFQLRETADRLGPLYFSTDALRYLVLEPIVYAYAAACAGFFVLWRDRRRRWAAVYTAGGTLTYLLLLTFVTPGFYDTFRYMLPAAPLVVVAVAALLKALDRGMLGAIAFVLAAFFLVRPATDVALDQAPRFRAIDYSFENISELTAAQRLNRIAPRGATVLAYEVQSRFQLRPDLDVLSLDGITDGKVIPYAERGDIAGFLRRYRPRYWIADTATRPPRGGEAPVRPYLVGTPLMNAVARFEREPRLRTADESGIRFRLIERRPGQLPYRFGAWTMLFELSYE